MTKLKIGVIGCGQIATTYMSRASEFAGIEMVACADMRPAAAEAAAQTYGLRALSVDALIEDPEVDIVLNLTIPKAHYDISKRALENGKHVYSEKPYVLSLDEGRDLARIAEEKGLRIGSAPDTFLGASHQLARHLVDQGAVGKITSGTCFVMSHGMEWWHPNPDFFFLEGGGPVLDLAPYYLSVIVQILGPVARVSAMGSMPSPTRTITSEPRNGEVIPVEVDTTVHVLLEFASGAIVTMVLSWDVWQHDMAPIALYGETGTLHLPDPNYFSGEVRMTDKEAPAALPEWPHPFAPANRDMVGTMVADYRTAGLSDMAQAIVSGAKHRCNDEFALHVVEVMQAAALSSAEKRFVEIESTCERPEPLGPEAAAKLLNA